MVTSNNLVAYLHDFLAVDQFEDYAPNGLQVTGNREINALATAVTASQRVIDEAIQLGADALLVHHGYFWKGEQQTITGIKYKRIKSLIQSELALFAYHLPLDAHPIVGNNAQLAERLAIKQHGVFCKSGTSNISWYGILPSPISTEQFSQQLTALLGREALCISGGTHSVSRIGICTGGAQGYIEEAALLGLDAFVSGEISEKTTHQARELGIHYFAAGHHATERYGVQALAEHLANEFGITHYFIDEDNPA